MSEGDIFKTPLYDCHVDLGGRMVEFAGYMLPVQYTGVIAEHKAVRAHAGLFDVSHMGELLISGRGALDNLQRILTNDFRNMKDGQARYTLMCTDEGGVVDDLLVYKKGDGHYLLAVNASNRRKDADWIAGRLEGEARMEDISDGVAQIALQGPASDAILARVSDAARLPVKYYTFSEDVAVAGVKCLVSRTGYTGEDGYELYMDASDAVQVWKSLLDAGADAPLVPAGLGARDTLRFEAAMPLYGHEMDAAITPFEANLSFGVKMNKGDFIGRAALEQKGEPPRLRAGLRVTGKGIAREHQTVYAGDKAVGATTSGTFCPYLGYAAAMAIVDRKYAELGTALEVDVRGRRVAAEVVPLPFYKRVK
ncbi:aminomethyltransferase [Synergistales bacterium]|nr:aminomethyltransferase [Synergistales bacterium]